MRRIGVLLGVLAALAGVPALATLMTLTAPTLMANEESWTGEISDHICAWSHMDMAQQVGYTDRQCALECVKSGGKFVLVIGGAVFQITNQDFAPLRDNAGRTVKLTGEKEGDAIVVSKIEAAPQRQ
jgi:hypothetical protein